MHFLGGAVVSIFTVLVLTLLNFRSEHTNKIIGLALFSTLCVGVLWEIFELYIGYTSFSDGSQYIFDTAKDLVMDMSGGLFAGLYGLKVLSQKK